VAHSEKSKTNPPASDVHAVAAGEQPRKSIAILRRTRSANDSDLPAESAASSIIFSQVFTSLGLADGTSAKRSDETGLQEADDFRERDILDAAESREDAKGATISRSVTIHEPWYARAGKGAVKAEVVCVNGCTDAEVVEHCNTCGVNMCVQCAHKHASEAKTRSHEVMSYDEKKMAHLKTGGWNVKIMLGLGMNDDDTVSNLSKKFQEAQLEKSVLRAFKSRGKQREGNSMLQNANQQRARAMRTGEASEDPSGVNATAYLVTGEPGMGDFVNPPSRPVGPLFRQSPKIMGTEESESHARSSDAMHLGASFDGDDSPKSGGEKLASRVNEQTRSKRYALALTKESQVRSKKTVAESQAESHAPGSSVEWAPTDGSGRLMNFFDSVRAVPDMRKVFIWSLLLPCTRAPFCSTASALVFRMTQAFAHERHTDCDAWLPFKHRYGTEISGDQSKR
jgi:hypothetical protein